MTDVFASPRDANTVFATMNNYQRGDYKPYVVRSTDRGRTWTSIAGNLPARSGAWSVVQDHVNGNLLFAGLEFGVWFTVDGGQSWTQLKAGLPTMQARDLTIQRREHDLVVGTFGRGAFILDDYSALRELTPQVLTEEARLLPLRDTYLFEELGQQQAAWGNETTPNPPVGAVFTYAVGKAPEGDAKLVLTITDDAGRQVRRLEVPKTTGLNRATWNLRADPASAEGGRGGGGRGAAGGGAGGRGAGGRRRREPALVQEPGLVREQRGRCGRGRGRRASRRGRSTAASGRGTWRTAGSAGRSGPLSRDAGAAHG